MSISLSIVSLAVLLNAEYVLSGFSLAFCEHKLYEISQEIRLLQTRLDFLSIEKKRGRIAKQRARSRLQPIGRLPNEILGHIIRYLTIPAGASIWRVPALAVSHAWRDCALKQPMIWQHVFIREDTKAEELVTWLARSQAASLHIHYEPCENASEEHLFMCQSIINPHIQRIQRLYYDVGLKTEQIFPLTLPSHSLRTLSLMWDAKPGLGPPRDVFQNGSPLGLHDLSLDTYFIYGAQVILNDFDASKLIRLEAGQAVTLSSVWSTLSRSKALRHLIWWIHREDPSVPDSVPPDIYPVSLPHLRSLDLWGDLSRTFLEGFHAPDLQSLRIRSPNTSLTSIESLLPGLQSHLQLRKLVIGGFRGITHASLRVLFQTLPLLEVFNCDVWSADNISALEELTPYAMGKLGNNSWCAPHLRLLTIDSPVLVTQDQDHDSDEDEVEEDEDAEHAELVRGMNKFIHLLLAQRQLYAAQSLTVVLRRCEPLKDFGVVEGVQWIDDPKWLNHDRVDVDLDQM